ncbi:hypothetical protein [Alkalihalobacillus sp. TS-13]|uniref:hypothetical protein n=1 Tax=Alkalihalobacillus sp. TS-13 TaxID=2842455 RepID=UPI001C8894BC|nr:hypothetical protein [Alkalihalobacillus sp. TS-13]
MQDYQIKHMRKRQFIAINIITSVTLFLFMVMLKLFDVTLSVMSFIVGLILLSQVLIKLFKDKTSSWLPVFEEVAKYEKEKIGSEWDRQYKSQLVLQAVVSGWMFFQSYFMRDAEGSALQSDWSFMVGFVFILFLFVNGNLWFQNRKIDRSVTSEAFKGYTKKSIIVGTIIGLLLAFVVMTATIIFTI